METDECPRPPHSVTEEKQFSSWLAIECVLGGLLFIVQLDKQQILMCLSATEEV